MTSYPSLKDLQQQFPTASCFKQRRQWHPTRLGFRWQHLHPFLLTSPPSRVRTLGRKMSVLITLSSSMKAKKNWGNWIVPCRASCNGGGGLPWENSRRQHLSNAGNSPRCYNCCTNIHFVACSTHQDMNLLASKICTWGGGEPKSIPETKSAFLWISQLFAYQSVYRVPTQRFFCAQKGSAPNPKEVSSNQWILTENSGHHCLQSKS